MSTDPLRVPVLLSLQRALLGEIFSSLVAVRVSWSERAIRICWFVDGSPSEEERESVSAVETEVLADFPADTTVESEILSKDRYDPHSKAGVCVYATAVKAPTTHDLPGESLSPDMRRRLHFILHRGLVEVRLLAQAARTDQVRDLADVLEPIPAWLNEGSKQVPPVLDLKAQLQRYEQRYPGSFIYSDFVDRYEPPAF